MDIPSYFCTIRHPSQARPSAIPTFVTSSRDDVQQLMARGHGCTVIASTSSISPLLSTIYFAWSGFRPVNTQSFSFAERMPVGFTSTTRRPALFVFRNRGVTDPASDSQSVLWGVDNLPHSGTSNNQILSDLGNTMERMVTMSEDEFSKLVLLPGAHALHPTDVVDERRRQALSPRTPANPVGSASAPPLHDDYGNVPHSGPVPPIEEVCKMLADRDREGMLFSRMRSLLFRSQLDAYDRDSKMVFDLKTRATNPIRLDVGNYRRHLDYMLLVPTGELFSFERERFDLARAAFLKYGFQCRIGAMGGVMVAYHNTEQIFGFEFIPLAVMDEYVYGSAALADRAFEVTTYVAERVLTYVQQRFPDAACVRIGASANEQTGTLEFFLEVVDLVKSERFVRELPPNAAVAHSLHRQSKESSRQFLSTRTDNESSASQFLDTYPDLGDPSRWVLLLDQLKTSEIVRRLKSFGQDVTGSRAELLSRLENYVGSHLRTSAAMPSQHYESLVQRGLLHKLEVSFQRLQDEKPVIGPLDANCDLSGLRTTMTLRDVTPSLDTAKLSREYQRFLSPGSSAQSLAQSRRRGSSSRRTEPDIDVDVQVHDDHLPNDELANSAVMDAADTSRLTQDESDPTFMDPQDSADAAEQASAAATADAETAADEQVALQ